MGLCWFATICTDSYWFSWYFFLNYAKFHKSKIILKKNRLFSSKIECKSQEIYMNIQNLGSIHVWLEICILINSKYIHFRFDFRLFCRTDFKNLFFTVCTDLYWFFKEIFRQCPDFLSKWVSQFIKNKYWNFKKKNFNKSQNLIYTHSFFCNKISE